MHRFLPFLILVIALVSCTEGSYERHESFFYPQRPDGQLLYADQTTDTTLIFSLDSWNMHVGGFLLEPIKHSLRV